MRLKPALPVAAALALSAAAASVLAAGNPMAGTWSHSSNGSELALRPQVKIVPSIMATGTTVGTFGSGTNQMSTVIQNEYSSVKTGREMLLSVRPDGRFLWDIVKISPTSAKDPKCMGTLHESKQGTVQFSGGKVTFVTTGGTQSFKDTCNANRNNTSPYAPRSETYDYSVSGGALRIKGTGGVDWAFRRK